MTKEIVEFDDYVSLEPNKLLSFTTAYLDHLDDLKLYLNKNKAKEVSITVARLNSKGQPTKKIIKGLIKEINSNNFIFSTNEDFSSLYENKIDLLLRFDNPLGIVPVLPELSEDIKIFSLNRTSYSNYFQSLDKMKEAMYKCIGQDHCARLSYRYSSNSSPVLRNGNYVVECEILEVNKSNVKFKHIRTFSYIDKENLYLDIRPNIDFDRFVAQDRYLKKVSISPNTCNINIYDS